MKNPNFNLLRNRILNKEARISIVGLGYVGLPYAMEFARNGFRVTGIDSNEKKVEALRSGESYIMDIGHEELREINGSGAISYTSSYDGIDDADVIDICVPTPLGKSRDPDLFFITSAVRSIKAKIRKPKLLVLTSTTYPGTTREYVAATVSDSGFVIDRDFFVAFSPERIDPANRIYKLANIPKVVGGVTELSGDLAILLFRQIVKDVIRVSSSDTAEMVKLLENTFRSINIGLVNEMAIICNKLGIDVWEVIDAAKTKPYGYVPFYPGPGIGGHCIPIDPVYLTWRMKVFNYRARFIELATDINNEMPYYVVNRLAEILNNDVKSIKDSRIFIVGVAYKKDVNDSRESSAITVIEEILRRGGRVLYNDPYIAAINENGLHIKSTKLSRKALASSDCTLILTDHAVYSYEWIVRHSRRVFDTKNATKNIKSGKIVRL